MKMLIASVYIVLLLAACTPTKKTDENTESKQEEKVEISTPETNVDLPATAFTDADGLLEVLQGNWTRTSYPYGTLEIKGEQIKITEGEGNTKPAEFQNFKFADVCPYATNAVDEGSYLDYMVMENEKTCTSIKLQNDTLAIQLTNDSEGIKYVRSDKKQDLKYKISKNLQGTWATAKENCGTKNENVITITENSIVFSKQTFELTNITEYEPARIVGNFFSLDGKSKKTQSQFLLNIKNEGKELVMRKYGAAAEPGITQYFKCD